MSVAVAPADADLEIERSLITSGLGSAETAGIEGQLVVPVIDLSQSDAVVQKELLHAARTIGFFTVVNHGIGQDLIDQAFRVSEEFFHQSLEEKKKQSPHASRLNSGYEYLAQVRPSTGTADQKESLQITARKGTMEGRWPSYPSNLRAVSEDLMEQSLQLSQRILTLLQTAACPNLQPPSLIADSHTLWGDDGQCTLRLLHYPPMDRETIRKFSQPDANGRVHWRAGPHTDWSNLSLLFQTGAGLECRANPRQHQNNTSFWTPVDPMEGGIAVNIGDMLSHWSSHQLLSNLHRVRLPKDEEAECSRYSIAFFAQSNKSAWIAPTAEAAGSTAGEYLLSRLMSNYKL